MLDTTGTSSVITGSISHRSPYFNLVEENADGTVKVSKELSIGVDRRQDVPRSFDMDASIYVWRAEAFRREAKVFYPDTRLFEMPRERSLDIDTPIDFEIVEYLGRRQSSNHEVSI